jgi:hypothetical protein
MIIHLSLNEAIINECLKLHYSGKEASGRLRQRLILIPVALIALSAYLIYNELQRETPGQNLYMAYLYIGFAIAYYFFMRYRTIKGGKQLLRSLGSNSTFEMDVTNEKLTTTTKAGSFDTTWDSFTGATISKENVLLYQSNNSFSMFNYRFFESGDFETFKQMVREKVKPVTED